VKALLALVACPLCAVRPTGSAGACADCITALAATPRYSSYDDHPFVWIAPHVGTWKRFVEVLETLPGTRLQRVAAAFLVEAVTTPGWPRAHVVPAPGAAGVPFTRRGTARHVDVELAQRVARMRRPPADDAGRPRDTRRRPWKPMRENPSRIDRHVIVTAATWDADRFLRARDQLAADGARDVRFLVLTRRNYRASTIAVAKPTTAPTSTCG